MGKPTLFLLMGYPGAGKTFVAKKIEKLTGAVRLSSDKIRFELFKKPIFSEEEHQKLYQYIDSTAKQLLAEGRDVIYDANLNRRLHRQQKYAICRQVGAKPVLLWLATDKDLSKTRASRQERQHLWPKNESPDQMFDRIAEIIEKPGPEEKPVKLDGHNLSDDQIKQAVGLWRE